MGTSLSTAIAEKITKEFKQSNKLPTQKELMDHYYVSRSTIIKALDLLKSQGLIYSIQGCGVFFVANKLPLYLEGVYSYDYQLIQMGIEIENTLVSFKIIEPNMELVDSLNLNENEKVFEIIRQKIDKKTKEVMIVQYNYLNAKRFAGLIGNNLQNRRLYVELYENFELNITDAIEEIELTEVSTELQKLSNSKDKKVLEITRTAYENDKVFEYTKSYLITDKIKYTISLNLNK